MKLEPNVTRRIREIDKFRPAGALMSRQCRARISLPDRQRTDIEVMFTCTRAFHGATHDKGKVTIEGGDPHAEIGRVRTKDGRVVVYEFKWWDDFTPRQVWRRHDDPHAS